MKITSNISTYCLELFEKIRYSDSPGKIQGVARYYNVEHVQWVFTRKDGIGYVFFIGSNEFWDWVHNFMFRLRETPYCGTNRKLKVHSGFYQSYLEARGVVHSYVKDFGKVVIFGHSLGGAIATLCAVDIQYNFPEKEIGYFSIGSPRVGNRVFAESFNGRLPDAVRCVNGNDVVTKIPFGSMGFSHVANLKHIGDRKWYPSVRDHSVRRYRKNFPSA